ncbi:ankyrin repeat domain-containing protein [Archangium lipolyticum]|uniref:ankyrin repeat domain-containing protein n=1 Tax=Archangium lipolyticum TaxID=2970465 RepID=UPI002149BBBB|nr:ankyrin repeat domain-containing protein [Archangium lipolyticum]
MGWERIKRWFSRSPGDPSGRPPPKADGGLASLPDIPWLQPEANPWGVPVLDVRPVTLGMLSASKSPEAATNLVSMGQEDGTVFIGAQPLVPRRITTDLRFRVDAVLPDGVLFSPREMEHKWGLYLLHPHLLVVRSWTRQVHAVADFERRGDTLVITSIAGALTGQEEPPSLTVLVLDFLLRTHALSLPYPAPLPEGLEAEPKAAATWCMSMFGNQVHFATPHPLPPTPPEAMLRTDSLLHIAVARGDTHTVDRQLDAGVPLTVWARDGLTPLHWALVSRQGTAMLEHLLTKGSPVDVRSVEGATPLMNATQSGRDELLSWLLDHGADPNAVDARGFTALHRAAEMGHLECVRILLARGARPDPAAQGHTPRSLAEHQKHEDIVRLLGG